MRRTIKAAAFDFGKVIAREPDPNAVVDIAKMAGIPVDEFLPVLYGIRDGYDRGTWDGKEYYREVLARLGAAAEERVLEKMAEIDTDSWKTLNPETLRLIADIKSAGLKTAILSNMPHDFLRYARTNIPLFSQVDAGIFSCEWSLIKPERGIYEALAGTLDLSPGEIVFFDDIPANIDAARAFGIQGILWQDAATARHELRRRGIVERFC
ncbi:MAG: HAD family phosphatase [Spirochaetaceae bacterium]|jgi:putative hydrolase of the HAD superfamily|nr:HAD family phosphatase [Spirochaetaceae bacterium]